MEEDSNGRKKGLEGECWKNTHVRGRQPGDKNDGVYNRDGISIVLSEGQKSDGERSELLFTSTRSTRGPRTDQQSTLNDLLRFLGIISLSVVNLNLICYSLFRGLKAVLNKKSSLDNFLCFMRKCFCDYER